MSSTGVYLKAFEIKQAVKLASARGLNTGQKTQKYIDNEVLRLSEPYVPLLTKALIRSGPINTKVGSGEVIYKTPYARRQYYENAGRGREGLNNGGRKSKSYGRLAKYCR